MYVAPSCGPQLFALRPAFGCSALRFRLLLLFVMAFSAASDVMLAFALRGAFGTIPPAPLVQPAASTSAGPAAASVTKSA